ncbi:MAG: SDR family NAD(P)-dependent oxidoreductase [Bacteroidia bacterium]|nr:SDR family NAD(P)-dependent oxidoreductase [Bacteroidia bacterium]
MEKNLNVQNIEKTDSLFAVITGASMGLGKCFALELSKRKINTILVSLPGEDIHRVAEECRKYGVESLYIETDLTQKENILSFTDWLNENFNVNILINNVGTGGTAVFHKTSLKYIENILHLNIITPSMITHQLLPNLMRQDSSYILNVSSIASFSPMGFKTVYPASKKFIQYFARGLHQELKNTSVFVSVVHPGPMITNEETRVRIGQYGIFGRLGLLTPEGVAAKSITELFKRNPYIVPGLFTKLQWIVMMLIPVKFKLPILARLLNKEIRLGFHRD